MNDYKYIVIEGNIGAGKTSLAKMLALKFNSGLLLEEFEENSFLEGFYANPEKYAFPLELAFLADRYHQINTFDFGQSVVSDYHFLKSKAFAGHTLNKHELELFNKMSEIMMPKLPKVDLLIYLRRSPKALHENIKHRGRDYEQNISLDYLKLVEKSYVSLLEKIKDAVVLILECDGLDFVNNVSDYRQVLNLLDKNYPNGITKINMIL